jgi:hypothetical protein
MLVLSVRNQMVDADVIGSVCMLLPAVVNPSLELRPHSLAAVDYLAESYHKQCLYSRLTSFNLMSTVNFPTRIQNYFSTATENMFIDSSRKDISIDHDAQLLVVKKV